MFVTCGVNHPPNQYTYINLLFKVWFLCYVHQHLYWIIQFLHTWIIIQDFTLVWSLFGLALIDTNRLKFWVVLSINFKICLYSNPLFISSFSTTWYMYVVLAIASMPEYVEWIACSGHGRIKITMCLWCMLYWRPCSQEAGIGRKGKTPERATCWCQLTSSPVMV